MDLHVLGCHEHDLTIFEKCLSVCVWPYFLASVARELKKTEIHKTLYLVSP